MKLIANTPVGKFEHNMDADLGSKKDELLSFIQKAAEGKLTYLAIGDTILGKDVLTHSVFEIL